MIVNYDHKLWSQTFIVQATGLKSFIWAVNTFTVWAIKGSQYFWKIRFISQMNAFKSDSILLVLMACTIKI